MINDVHLGQDPAEIVDYGNAPEIFVSGLARVDIMGGVTRFALFTRKVITSPDGYAQLCKEVTHSLIFPTEEVGPGVELTLATFGPRILLPTAGYILRRLIM